MANGRGFFLVWSPQPAPERWIVSMPGRRGIVTDEFALWAPHLRGRNVGLVEVQWWLGKGDGVRDYLTPQEIYRELEQLLPSLGVKPGRVLLHGFSRGSANIYAVAALDGNAGQRYFTVFVANSGGVALDYPPTRAVENGDSGTLPYKNTLWITVCGERDPQPERDGCPGMRRAAAWLQQKGATIAMAIEDQKHGHGALHANPENAARVLDWYLQQ